jgi:3-phenylpropionate/cinnamic acid dioxygenase small subunit
VTELTYSPALAALTAEIEHFLYREGDLVDDRRFDEWLALFADDLQYRVPLVRNVRAQGALEQYRNAPLDVAWFDEGKETLAQRVAQIRTGVHWAEEPASRTVHLVSNVRVTEALPLVERAEEVEARCKVLVYRHRNEDQEDTLVGHRVDRLRRNGAAWQIVRRTVYVKQSVMLANTLSFFV